jgi:hypothetical protein
MLTKNKGLKEGLNESQKSEPNEEPIVSKVISVIKRVTPIPSQVLTKVWTYIEPLSETKEVHLLDNKGGVPEIYLMCIEQMKKAFPGLVVITPLNYREYVPDFPLYMDPQSEVPLRRRVDLLFAYLLNTYGGLCLSPGTIPVNIQELVHQSSVKDIVTSGTSPRLYTAAKSAKFPNTLVIGGSQGSVIVKEYQKQMMKHIIKNVNGSLDLLESYDILSEVLNRVQGTQFHIDSLTSGTYNKYLQKIPTLNYFSQNPILFSQKPLFLISLPYEDLQRKQYQYILNLSREEIKKQKYIILSFFT